MLHFYSQGLTIEYKVLQKLKNLKKNINAIYLIGIGSSNFEKNKK